MPAKAQNPGMARQTVCKPLKGFVRMRGNALTGRTGKFGLDREAAQRQTRSVIRLFGAATLAPARAASFYY